MTLQYTYVAPVLSINKMRKYPTKVINIIGGPGSNKSFYSAHLILYALKKNKTIETIPDYAKSLVWQNDMDALQNQFHIASQQYKMLSLLDGQVHYLINECSLPQLLYYNQYYLSNMSDVAKTKKKILDWMKEFENINILVTRDVNAKYINTGRFQDEINAIEVDKQLKSTLMYESIKFTQLLPEENVILDFAQKFLS